MCDILQECLSRFLTIESFGTGANQAFELRFANCDVLVILPTGFGKFQIYQVFCLAKNSASNPTASVLVILPLNSIVQEQFREYKFSELGLAFCHPFERLNWTFT